MFRPAVKIGAVLALGIGFALYVWLSGRLPPPREEDRVSHRAGVYSIVKPRGWEESHRYAPTGKYKDSIEVLAPTERARDRRIFVGRFLRPPDLATIAERDKRIADDFQGQPAHVFEGRTRLECYWRAIFQRGGEWYELVLWLPYPEDVPNSGWWPYLQSFRASESPTTRPFDVPTTLPIEPDGQIPSPGTPGEG